MSRSAWRLPVAVCWESGRSYSKHQITRRKHRKNNIYFKADLFVAHAGKQSRLRSAEKFEAYCNYFSECVSPDDDEAFDRCINTECFLYDEEAWCGEGPDYWGYVECLQETAQSCIDGEVTAEYCSLSSDYEDWREEC